MRKTQRPSRCAPPSTFSLSETLGTQIRHWFFLLAELLLTLEMFFFFFFFFSNVLITPSYNLTLQTVKQHYSKTQFVAVNQVRFHRLSQ